MTIQALQEGSETDRARWLPVYEEMQWRRIGRSTTAEFRALIRSVSVGGFSWKRPIPVTHSGELVDGAHRLACALYFDVPQVPIAYNTSAGDIRYGRDWFIQEGFGDDIVSALDASMESLLLESGNYFAVFLWPPAVHVFDNMSSWLSDNSRIVRTLDLNLGSQLSRFVREVYAADDIESWKIEVKLSVMKKFCPHVRVHFIDIDLPGFRNKGAPGGGSYLSARSEQFKSELRRRHRGAIDGYVHDVAIHIGDNHEHNRLALGTVRKFGGAI